MLKKLILSVVSLCALLSANGQVTLSGIVIDSETGKPVQGANIRVEHSLTGASTNGKGEFTIQNLPDGQSHKLSITHVSYLPAEYTASAGEKDIIIRLRESYINLGQVVVTGTGTHRRMTNSPVPIQVITAKDIQNAGVTSVEDALTRLMPNITTMTNGMGTFLNLNGIGQDYMLIMENGHRTGGDERMSRINVTNIKRIEVQSGAASALYGSEAIGGVINIITDDSKNGTGVNSYTHYTTHGRFTQSIDADVTAGRLSSYTTYQRKEADNWQVNDIDEDGYKTGRPMSAGFRSDNVSQRFTYSVNDKLNLSLRGNYNTYETRRPESATYFKKSGKNDDGSDKYVETKAYTYNMAHQTWLYGMGADYMISPSAYIEADFYNDNYTSSYRYFSKSGSFMPGDEQKRKETHYYDANIKGIFKPDGMNKLSVGMEYIDEQLKSESDNISFKSMFTAAVYAQDEISISENIQAVAGVRYLYNENFKSHATPNLSIMYKPGGFRFRAAYSTGYRSPTLSQLYATDQTKTASRYTVGNPDLKPEKSSFWSLNAEYSNQRFSVSATGLINNVTDMINYRTLTDADISALGYDALHAEYATIRQRDNIDNARIKSLSANANVYIGAGLTVGGGYVFTDTKAESDGKSTPVDKSVKHSGNVNARWDHDWGGYHLNVSLNGHLQGERYSGTYGYAPAYSQWDLNTKHTFYIEDMIIEPGIGIENILNERDTRPWNSNFSTINPGRSVYVSLALRFKE
ncbi:MAG: TonB-dependent receptor [Bacteroidaceae bacterium]|nr:TonB-dependent receptor [Bacteroidaceae bacterium]